MGIVGKKSMKTVQKDTTFSKTADNVRDTRDHVRGGEGADI